MNNDVMQVANTRKADLISGIKAREAEIADLREEIETLDEFMSYGQDLLDRSSGAQPAEKPIAKPADMASSVEDAADADTSDAFDTMSEDEDLAKSIAQLRPRSRPISRPA